MELRQLDPILHGKAVQEVLEAAPGYALAISGEPQPASAAVDLFTALPPGHAREQKFVLGIESDGKLVGVIDVVRGYPSPSIAFLGLLMLREDRQKFGYGKRAYLTLETLLGAWREIRTLRLGVVESNAQALGFWEYLGFRATGERKPFAQGKVKSTTILMEKSFHPHP